MYISELGEVINNQRYSCKRASLTWNSLLQMVF